jgi:hypothetical protein
MLTVSAIAISLATLILAAVFAAQEAGRNANCRSNLSQVHKLMMVYTQTYGQYLPAFWHERWVGELGLHGGQWRADITKLKQHPKIKPIWDAWDVYLRNGGKTFMPNTNISGGANPGGQWNFILAEIAKLYLGTATGYLKVDNVDDVNPLMPRVWNNYQPPTAYLGTPAGVEGRVAMTSSSPAILCPSDVSAYRCDQGALVSYMGLMKYGWWHRGGTDTKQRYYDYHQIQEVLEPTKGILLAETEPGTWQFGGCG